MKKGDFVYVFTQMRMNDGFIVLIKAEITSIETNFIDGNLTGTRYNLQGDYPKVEKDFQFGQKFHAHVYANNPGLFRSEKLALDSLVKNKIVSCI